jgi:O-antigen/teichoic acid export membrane protein
MADRTPEPMQIPSASAPEPFRAATEPVPLTSAEVKFRASAGLLVIGSRGLAILVIGLASSVVLARLLTPSDFGIVAIGLTFVTFIGLISDGGLGGGLIRREEPPSRVELGALLGLQLTVTTLLTAAVAGVAILTSEHGAVIAVVVASMPLVSLQFPGKILLERELRYRPLALVEVSQVVTYHLSAIILVLAGAGVWGLAIATVFRAAVGAAGMLKVTPMKSLRPNLDWSSVRSLIAFGFRFQLVSATWLGREQGLNVAVAAVAGTATLGLSSLARRLLEVPNLLLQSLWRVSFPAMSQLLAVKERPAPLVERALSVAVIGNGILLVGLVGSAPGLVPGLFGQQWIDAAHVLPGACLGLAVAGSVQVATQGYLYALGDVAAVLRATLLATVTMLALTVALLPTSGTWAIGSGMLAASSVEAVVLVRATNRHVTVRFAGILAVPVGAGCAAAALGWYLAASRGDLASGILGGLVAVAGYLGVLLVLRRSMVLAAYHVVRGAVTNARRSTSGARVTDG